MLKKTALFFILSLTSLSTMAASLNDIVQNFPVQITNDDQNSDMSGNSSNTVSLGDNSTIDKTTFIYNNAYLRSMNQYMLSNINNQQNNLSNNINSLYDFAGAVFTGQGTILNQGIKEDITNGFNLATGNSKYLYQEQAQIYSMINKGNSPNDVKNYIDTTAINVLSKVSNGTTANTTEQNNTTSTQQQNSSDNSSSSYQFNY